MLVLCAVDEPRLFLKVGRQCFVVRNAAYFPFLDVGREAVVQAFLFEPLKR